MNTIVVSPQCRSRIPGVDAHARRAASVSADCTATGRTRGSHPASRTVGRRYSTAPLTAAVLFRVALVAAPMATAMIAWVVGAGASQPAEPELATLLRGMAVLKGLLAAGALGIVWWRLGHSVPKRVAATYIACVSALFAASVLIWQLVHIPAAAVLFHVALLVALVVALREGRETHGLRKSAPGSFIEAEPRSRHRG